MNKAVWSCVALLALFVAVESLRCYTCEVKVLGACLGHSKTNCSAAQNRCFTGVAHFSHELMDVHYRGCIEESQCENTNGSILNINYTVTKHCCSGDLCNGATSIQLPVMTVLCAALVALWSQQANYK